MKLALPGFGGKYGAVLKAALLFFIVANPMTYQLVDALLGPLVGRIAGPGGAPTTLGLIVHSLVYGLVSVYVL
jgi:hypothetical protein